MKARRIIKFALIGFVAIIVLGVLGMVVWSKTGTYPARDVALSALESTDRVTVTQDRWIVFTPAEQTETGLIFYPGGLVEPTAYAPVLHKIAEEGVLVVITPMPLNLGILNTGAANAVIEAIILATRLTLLDKKIVDEKIAGIAEIVDKTGGATEREALRVVTDFIRKAGKA